ncbi:MAG: ComEC/Rec2 family competence protein [Candidatus Omnitrophica bacterium]|nr:ComEC/Rec2 family competence protein [Candidatus Omnitrophota bacterium]
MSAPLVPVTIVFILGIALQLFRPCPLGLVAVVGLLAGSFVLLNRRSWVMRHGSLLVLWLCLGMLRMAVWQAHPDHRLSSRLPEAPTAVRAHGVVISDPVERWGWQDRLEQRCVLRLLPMAGRVQLIVEEPRASLRYGDELLLEGRWSALPPPSDASRYDWRRTLGRERIHGQLRVKPHDGVIVLRRGQGWPWCAAVFQVRRLWQRRMARQFPSEKGRLLRAVLLGERAPLSQAVTAAFVETGTMHLLVISGSNVALIAWGLLWTLQFLGCPWRMRLVLAGFGVWAYAVLTGWQPPVVRAMLMAWLVLGAQWLDRIASLSNLLAAAALAILWVNPSQLTDPSFQLSFGAVLSLLWLMPRGLPRFQRWVAWLHPGWLRRYLALSLCGTTAVWIGLAPLLAWYFHLVTPIALLANVIVAPLIGLLVAAGTLTLLMSTGWPWVLAASRDALTLLVGLTRASVAWLHAIPGGSLAVDPPPWWGLAGYYALVALLLRLTKPARDDTMTPQHH